MKDLFDAICNQAANQRAPGAPSRAADKTAVSHAAGVSPFCSHRRKTGALEKCAAAVGKKH
jgi:hypothetical protein